MKKVYSKPEIVFENFSLTTNIAGGCEVKTWTPTNADLCAYQPPRFPDLNIFLEESSACTTKEADGEYDGFCYHIPTETNNLFNS